MDSVVDTRVDAVNAVDTESVVLLVDHAARLERDSGVDLAGNVPSVLSSRVHNVGYGTLVLGIRAKPSLSDPFPCTS